MRALHRRAAQHRSPSNGAGSKYIPEDVVWDIVELEKCPANISKERERYYIETLKPQYNFHTPGLTLQEIEFKRNRTDHRKEYQRAYQKTEAYKEKKRAYREKQRQNNLLTP